MSLNLCDSCCADCRHERKPNEIIVQCGAYKPPQSNADRIRSMSDEELAAWICSPDCEASRYETCITITTEKTFDIPYNEQTNPLHDVLNWLRKPEQEDRP